MPRPLIGITPSHTQTEKGLRRQILMDDYIHAVVDAGGIPLIIPVGLDREALHELQNRLDGVLLSGGGDIDIQRFNGRPHPRISGADVGRDTLEIDLVQSAAQNGKPLLGICRGIQVMNVALGGTLYTDLEDQFPGAIKHSYSSTEERNRLVHDVTVDGVRLAAWLDETRLMVNSLHHQGIEALAPGLAATACAPDGLIEAVELPQHPFFVGVQWHPECLPNSSSMQALFRAFVEACAGKFTFF